MTIAFISDLHINPQQPQLEAYFNDFCTEYASQLSQLYILGDLVEYWIGDDAADLLGYSTLEAMLTNLTKSGIEVFFIAGNRDFLIGEVFAQRTGVKILADETLITLGKESILLAHGDRYCTDDTELMQGRDYFLNLKWQQEFRATSIEQRTEFAKNLRAQSKQDKQSKNAGIMDVTDSAIVEAFERTGARTLIHGHTHRPKIHQHTIGNLDKERIVLGDWDKGISVLLYKNGHFDSAHIQA